MLSFSSALAPEFSTGSFSEIRGIDVLDWYRAGDIVGEIVVGLSAQIDSSHCSERAPWPRSKSTFKVPAVTRANVSDLMKRMSKSPTNANRVFSALRKMFNRGQDHKTTVKSYKLQSVIVACGELDRALCNDQKSGMPACGIGTAPALSSAK
jgi:hypothetical protein